jgi:hypothetical protein
LYVILLVTACFFLSNRAMAQAVPQRTVDTNIVVVTVDHLSLSALSSTRLPHLSALRDGSAEALVSPGLARFPNPSANEWATFTAGDVIGSKNKYAGQMQRTLGAAGIGDRVRIILFGDLCAKGRFAQLDRLIGGLLAPPGGWANGEVVILCPITPPQKLNGSWDELSPLLVFPGRFGETYESATTRTKGLVALRDLAPTILQMAGATIPPTMSGSPIVSCFIGNPTGASAGPLRNSALRRMETITQLGQNAIVPLAWLLGLFALFAIAGSAWMVTRGQAGGDQFVRYLLRLVIASPLAMLIAPCFPVSTIGQYMLALVGLDLTLALIDSPMLLTGLTSLVILIDCLTGSRLIGASAISGFWLSGIRFYGIGNEYMGVLIGMSLLLPPLILQRRSLFLPKGIASVATGLYYLLVIFVLSYPEFGAKAGGAVTSVVTFSLAWIAVYSNRRPTWVGFLAASLCGFILIFVLANFAQRLHAPTSHIQSAITAVHQGRLGYIKHVAVRKAKMAVRTVLTPGGLVAILGLIPLWIFWQRSILRSRVEDFLVSRPELEETLRAGGWGLLATLLYNDSGGVAFLFFFGAMALILMHEMVRQECVSSRLTSVMFA